MFQLISGSFVGGEGLVIEISTDEEEVVCGFLCRGQHDIEGFCISKRVTIFITKVDDVWIAFVLNQEERVFVPPHGENPCHVDRSVLQKLFILLGNLCHNATVRSEFDCSSPIATKLGADDRVHFPTTFQPTGNHVVFVRLNLEVCAEVYREEQTSQIKRDMSGT